MRNRVGETNIIEPKMPTSVDEVKALSRDELNLVIAISHASEIRAVVDRGDDVLHVELERWEPETRDERRNQPDCREKRATKRLPQAE